MFALAALCTILSTVAYISPASLSRKAPRVQPVYENFFLPIGEDPAENTPAQLYGEVAYKNFVTTYNPEGLIVGGAKYDAITRIRQLKLLSLTAESGLLEALEAKGVTLSQIEKLLPLADDLGVLPLVSANKGLILSILPLLIEPAPLLLPILVSVLKTDSTLFLNGGLALLAAGGYEGVLAGNGLLAAPLVLLGAPLAALGAVLSGSVSVPVPAASSVSASFVSTPAAKTFSAPAVSSNRPKALKPVAAKVVAAPKPVAVKVVATPKPVVAKAAAPVAVKAAAKASPVAAVKVAAKATTEVKQRVRKTVKVN
jgi:hypothetical protein